MLDSKKADSSLVLHCSTICTRKKSEREKKIEHTSGLIFKIERKPPLIIYTNIVDLWLHRHSVILIPAQYVFYFEW